MNTTLHKGKEKPCLATNFNADCFLEGSVSYYT